LLTVTSYNFLSSGVFQSFLYARIRLPWQLSFFISKPGSMLLFLKAIKTALTNA